MHILKRMIICAAIMLVASYAQAKEPFRFQEGKYEQGQLKYADGIPIVFLKGSPTDLGKQSGHLLTSSVKGLQDIPHKMLQDSGVEVVWSLVTNTARTMMKNTPEDYRRELHIASVEGGVDEGFLMVANTMLELRRIGGCSAFIVQAERSQASGPLFGRNLDLPPMREFDQYSVVSVVQPTGKHAFMSVGFPGIVGVISGMNDAGLCVGTLDVYETKDGSPMFDPSGVPLMFVCRRALEECTTVEEAIQLFRSVRHTTWMNVAVCDQKTGAIFEVTPKQVIVRRPQDDAVACTNHFRSKQLATSLNDCWRYEKFVKRIGEKGKVGLPEMITRIDEVNQGAMTMQSMVFDPAAKTLHLSLGKAPSSSRPFVALELEKLLSRTGL